MNLSTNRNRRTHVESKHMDMGGGRDWKIGIDITHYYIWTEEPGRLQSMASQKAGHNRDVAHACMHTHV